MTIGSPTTTSKAGVVKGLAYTCLQTINTRGSETQDFPTKPCPAGIMAIHHFPALVKDYSLLQRSFLTITRCWDGKNIDSPDHQSHMYSTTKTGTFVEAGPCPASHPVRMPQLAYETIWDTTKFNDKSLWPADGSQPFVVCAFAQSYRYTKIRLSF